MTKRLLMLLSLLFAVGLIAAGCGGDDDETTTTATTETTTEETTETGATGSADVDTPGTPEEATEQCLAQLDAFPAEISDDVREKIEDLCRNTDEVSVEEGREIAEEVCTLLVKDALPEGPQVDTALKACKQAGDGLQP